MARSLVEAEPKSCEYMYAVEGIITMELLQMFKLTAEPDREVSVRALGMASQLSMYGAAPHG